jgi:glucokinase
MRLALDIGATDIKCATVTEDGQIAASGSFPSNPALENDEFSAHVVNGARKFLMEHGGAVTIVGAGMAGFVDAAKGIIRESPNLPKVKNLELGKALTDGLELLAYVDNDATAAAWGEYMFGGHVDVKDMLAVTLGTGIGGGLVFNGKLYRGSQGMAGEIGQMVLIPAGPDCAGGGKGCLEYYIGKHGVMEDYRRRAKLDESVEPKEIYERAGKGDMSARESWKAYGQRLGVVLASSANLLDLGLIVLTGGILGAWDFFSDSMMKTFREHLITPHKAHLKVKRSNLKGKAGLLGASFLDKAE